MNRKNSPCLIKVKIELGYATFKLSVPRKWAVAIFFAAIGKVGQWITG